MSGNRVLDAGSDSARSMLPARRWGLRLLAVVALLAGWQAVATRSTILLAPPTEVFGVLLAEAFVDRTLLRAIVDALRQAALGYALAVAVGVPVGFLVGFWTPARDVLDPIIDALYATPMVALAPLIIIWFGLTVVAKVFLVFVFAVFVIIINTEAGVTETPEGLIEAARTFGANDRQVYSKVHFRHALPYVLTGLRLGAGRAIRGMVAAELFLYADQLGEYLIDSGATFRIARLLAGIVALSAVGVLAVGAVGRLERRLVR
jgi:NitT/TauT family transport system permease protein